MTSFTSENNLKIVGVTWFSTRKDAHWAGAMYRIGMAEHEVRL